MEVKNAEEEAGLRRRRILRSYVDDAEEGPGETKDAEEEENAAEEDAEGEEDPEDAEHAEGGAEEDDAEEDGDKDEVMRARRMLTRLRMLGLAGRRHAKE